MLPSAPRNAVSTRSGAVAKLVSPSSDAKTAPPIRAAPQSPVRIVPLNHCTESRRRSTRPPLPPSTESGGSLPRLIGSASNLRLAPRGLPGPRPRPLHSRSHSCTAPCGARPGSQVMALHSPSVGLAVRPNTMPRTSNQRGRVVEFKVHLVCRGPQFCGMPDTTVQRTAEECGRSAAQGTLN